MSDTKYINWVFTSLNRAQMDLTQSAFEEKHNEKKSALAFKG